jgi:hypothetical protein
MFPAAADLSGAIFKTRKSSKRRDHAVRGRGRCAVCIGWSEHSQFQASAVRRQQHDRARQGRRREKQRTELQKFVLLLGVANVIFGNRLRGCCLCRIIVPNRPKATRDL